MWIFGYFGNKVERERGAQFATSATICFYETEQTSKNETKKKILELETPTLFFRFEYIKYGL